MTSETLTGPVSTTGRRRGFFDIGGWLLTLLAAAGAAIWFFPIYWAVTTSFKTDDEAVRLGINLLPEGLHLDGYAFVN